MDRGYFAVRPDIVLLARSVFHIRPSMLEAGEKRLLLTAQAITNGKSSDRWGHHATAVIQKFCDFTASSQQPPLPWQELIEDAHHYYGQEGVSSRTGNRPLGTTIRYHVDAQALRTSVEAVESSEHFATAVALPHELILALLDGTWPSISQETATRLGSALSEHALSPLHQPDQSLPAPDTETPRSLLDLFDRTGLRIVLAVCLAGLLVGGLFWSEISSAPEAMLSRNPEIVGYWDYDGADGAHLIKGLVLVKEEGAAFGERWQQRLELINHDQLPPRERNMWPVELDRGARKVCINYPEYPSYAAHIDLPDDASDGIYLFGPCANGHPIPGPILTR